jgi:hypothetical protein
VQDFQWFTSYPWAMRRLLACVLLLVLPSCVSADWFAENLGPPVYHGLTPEKYAQLPHVRAARAQTLLRRVRLRPDCRR